MYLLPWFSASSVAHLPIKQTTEHKTACNDIEPQIVGQVE